MFRKTTITITLAAAAFVAVGSTPAPAEAFDLFEDFDCVVEPLHCIWDEASTDGDRDRAEGEPTLDTSDIIDAIGGGGLVFPIPTGPTLTPGGVSTDVSPGTVITPELPDGVLDAITESTVELPPVDLPPIEAPEAPEAPATPEAPVAPAAPATGPEAPSSERGAAVAPAHVEAPTAATPRTVAPAASDRVARQTTSTTSVAAQDETTQEQADELGESVETLFDTDATSSFDPLMAALFGMLGALALMLAVIGAFAAGRRRN